MVPVLGPFSGVNGEIVVSEYSEGGALPGEQECGLGVVVQVCFIQVSVLGGQDVGYGTVG